MAAWTVGVGLVLALGGIAWFVRAGEGPGPRASSGITPTSADEELLAAIDAEAEARVSALERENRSAGVPGDAAAGRQVREVLRAQLRAELLPLLRERVRTARDAEDAAQRARAVLATGRR